MISKAMFSALSQFIFGTSSIFNPGNTQVDNIKTSTWKDKRLCFDLRGSDLELIRGEQLIACFYPIEDVKGNQDELGVLKVTNLRLIWICFKKKKVNLSIGWRTVTLTYEQNLKDTLCDNAASLFVLSKYESTKYEFVFARKRSQQTDIWLNDFEPVASVGESSQQKNWLRLLIQLKGSSKEKSPLISHVTPMYLHNPFEVVFKVSQAYKHTQLFRHCRSNLSHLINTYPDRDELEAAVSSWNASNTRPDPSLKLEDLNKLPSEEIIEFFSNVAQNEVRSVKYNGTLLLTNIRLIWIDETIQSRNLSIPHIRINSIKLKANDKLQVNTHDYLASSTNVEFQIQKSTLINGNKPIKSTKLVFERIHSLHLEFKSEPRFGPESCDDCINFMGHLRPVEQYFESLNNSMLKNLENSGPDTSAVFDVVDGMDPTQIIKNSSKNRAKRSNMTEDSNDDEIERTEADLQRYSNRLNNYLNEQPLDFETELIYSSDLGLAMEKPENGASIKSIWQIEI